MSDAKQTFEPQFAQLLVFTDCADVSLLVRPVERLEMPAILYKDLTDPQGVGLLTIASNPGALVADVRDVLGTRAFRVLMQRHELTMIGRTFGQADTDPGDVITNHEWPWTVWSPLRATAELAALDDDRQLEALDELIAAGGADPTDAGHIRLKSHGLDRAGNDFLHGVHGRDLGEISTFIETIRRAESHAAHIASTGPYFVGRAVRGEDTELGAGARW